MEETGKIDIISGGDRQPCDTFFEKSEESNAKTMNDVSDSDVASVEHDDKQPEGLTEQRHEDMDLICLKEETTEENEKLQRDTWMDQSVKIRQNVVDMLEYVSFQLQSNLPEESLVQYNENIQKENEGVGIVNSQMPNDSVAFAGSEDEEILPDIGGSGSCLPFATWTSRNIDRNIDGDSGLKGERTSPSYDVERCNSPEEPAYDPTHDLSTVLFKEGNFDLEQCKREVVKSDNTGPSDHETEPSELELEPQEIEMETHEQETEETVDGPEEHVHPGVLGDNMFTSSDVNIPPCVSQEEVIVDCADGGTHETQVPLSFSGTFNNFKDAEVTVEMNEEEVDILGAGSPTVRKQDFSEDDSDSCHDDLGYHTQPVQQAMFHAMAPLPQNNGGNTTVPFSSQVISSNSHTRGVKREYPDEMPIQGPVRTKAARKITPPSPEKKEPIRESSSISNANKSLQENLRKQELDETFFTCDFCFKLFRRRNALMAHIKLHEALNIGNHNGHIYACKQCKKTFSSRYNLNHHTKRCHGEKEYKCVKCNEAYATQSDLSRHSRTHGVKSYKCNRCGKVFQKRKTFSAHVKVHPQVIYECITCFQKFSWEEELVDHNKIHQIPDSAPDTALTVSSKPSVTTATANSDSTVPASKSQGKKSNSLKLDYCYSYINRVKTQFAEQPQVYQDFLNTVKQFKFKSIDIGHFLEQISTLFKDHPNLIDGFNIFLPDECKVEIPQPPKKQALAVHDPLLDRQYNPRGELDDSLAYLGQVKARFSDKPIIYNTFTYIIKEYKLNSLQIPEVAARVTSLFKDHPDLILGFNTFLPPNNRISVPCYDSQQEESDVTLHLADHSNNSCEPHVINRNGHKQQLVRDDSETLAVLKSPQNKLLCNGHTNTATDINVNIASIAADVDKCVNSNGTENSTGTPASNSINTDGTNNNSHVTSRVASSEMQVVVEHSAIEKHFPGIDTIADNSEANVLHNNLKIRNDDTLEDEGVNVTDSNQHKSTPVDTLTKINRPVTTNVDSFKNANILQESIATTRDSPEVIPGVNILETISSSGENNIALPSEGDYEHVLNNNDVVASKSTNVVNNVAGVVPIADTFTNVITVSPGNSSNALTSIERTVAVTNFHTNSNLPKVSVISAVAAGRGCKTPKYTGKSIAFTSVNVKPNAIPKNTRLLEVNSSRPMDRPSPTKIVPLKNSLLYQQLIGRSNFRGRSNPSLATFTKIDTPGLDDNKETLNTESKSSPIKINTMSNIRNPVTFKSGSKISVPYIVNSPNSNVIFTLANTMVDDSTNVHGLANNLTITNPNFFTSTGSDGAESNNSKTVYTVAGNNTPTSSANVALISTNTLQNVSSTNSYTGLNIVTSTNVAPSTYTLANTKSIASFPAAVPTGNGANKQMLLIRTNPPSNTFLITNSGGRLLSGNNAIRAGCLVPTTKTVASNVNSSSLISSEMKIISNSKTNEVTQNALSKQMLALTTKKLMARTNNTVVKPSFLAGQKIAIVKSCVSGESFNNPNTTTAINCLIPDAVDASNVVNITRTTSNIANTSDGVNTSPKKRKIVSNRIVTSTNINLKKKMESTVRNYIHRNRPLLPAGGSNSQSPFVVSFVPNAARNLKEESSISVSSNQSNSQAVRTYERSVANTHGIRVEDTVLQQLGFPCNNPQTILNVKTKAARKQCLIAKSVSVADELKPSAAGHNGTSLAGETCPKTYSRRDSLNKQASGTHSPEKNSS